MRCLACDVELSDYEATRTYESAPAVHIDLCDRCLATIREDLQANERPELEGYETKAKTLFGKSNGEEK